MFELLRNFLIDNVTPELRDSITTALVQFDELNIEDYQLEYESILLCDNDLDINEVPTKILSLTIQYQQEILRAHGITLNDVTSIRNNNIIIDALLDLPDYSDKELILRTVELDLNSNEVCAELLSLVCNLSVDELLILIEDVDTSFIGKVKSIFEEDPVEYTEEELLIREKCITTYKRYMGYVQAPLQLTKFISNGIGIGHPFAVYANLYGSDLEAFTVEIASMELLGIALISSDGYLNPISAIKANLNNYISDMDKLTKIDIKIGQLLIGFNL